MKWLLTIWIIIWNAFWTNAFKQSLQFKIWNTTEKDSNKKNYKMTFDYMNNYMKCLLNKCLQTKPAVQDLEHHWKDSKKKNYKMTFDYMNNYMKCLLNKCLQTKPAVQDLEHHWKDSKKNNFMKWLLTIWIIIWNAFWTNAFKQSLQFKIWNTTEKTEEDYKKMNIESWKDRRKKMNIESSN